jgi:hypothetical protein
MINTELIKEDRMDAIEDTHTLNGRKKKRRARVSTAELYEAPEGLLPIVETEMEILADFIENLPSEDNYDQEVEQLRRGNSAIEFARRLIASKTRNIRRQQRLLRDKLGQAGQP